MAVKKLFIDLKKLPEDLFFSKERIMKNNKGFTLAELLVTLAVFSIVMVMLVGVLRGATVSYKNESMEVAMQEDASMTLSVLEELLVDSTSFSYLSNGFRIVNPSGTYNVVLNGNEVVVNGDVLCDCIDTSVSGSGLQITGWEPVSTNPGTDPDNAVKVSLKLNKGGYTYKAEQQVYFRNKIENNLSGMITSASSTGGGGTSSDITLDVKRYAVIDLKDKFGIDTGWAFGGSGGNYAKFKFCNSDGSDPDPYGPTQYIKLDSSVNSSFDTSVVKGDNVTIKSGSTTVYLTIDKVKFDCGNGVLVLPYKKTNHGSQDAFEIEGYDLYWAVKRDGSNCKIQAVPYLDNNSNHKFDTGENARVKDKIGGNDSDYNVQNKTIKNIQLNSDGSITYGGDSMQFNNNYLTIKVMGDYFGRGYIINYTENTEPGTKGFDDELQSNKLRLNLRFDLPGATKYYYVDFRTVCQGNTMTTDIQGNTYEENKPSP